MASTSNSILDISSPYPSLSSSSSPHTLTSPPECLICPRTHHSAPGKTTGASSILLNNSSEKQQPARQTTLDSAAIHSNYSPPKDHFPGRQVILESSLDPALDAHISAHHHCQTLVVTLNCSLSWPILTSPTVSVLLLTNCFPSQLLNTTSPRTIILPIWILMCISLQTSNIPYIPIAPPPLCLYLESPYLDRQLLVQINKKK